MALVRILAALMVVWAVNGARGSPCNQEEECEPREPIRFEPWPRRGMPGSTLFTPEGQPNVTIDLVTLPSAGPPVLLGIAYVPGYESPWIGVEGSPVLGHGWSWTFPCLVRDDGAEVEPNSITLVHGGINRAAYFRDSEHGGYVSYLYNTVRLARGPDDRYTLADAFGNRITFAGFSDAWPAPQRGKPLSYESPRFRAERGVLFEWTPAGLLNSITDSARRRWLFDYDAGRVCAVAVETRDGLLLHRAVFLYGGLGPLPSGERLRAVSRSLPGDPAWQGAWTFYYHPVDPAAPPDAVDPSQGLLAAVLDPDVVASHGGIEASLALDAETVARSAHTALTYERRSNVPAVVVSTIRRQGCASCGQSPAGSFTLSYASNAAGGAMNTWSTQVTQQSPEGNVIVADYNLYGQLLNQVRFSSHGATMSEEFFTLRYDEAGRLAQLAYPFEGHTYDAQRHAEILSPRRSDGAGMARRFRYDDRGRLIAEEIGKVSAGETGPWVLVRRYAYEGDLPWPSEQHEYPTEGGASVVTRFQHEFLGPPEERVLLRMVETLPAVPVEQNGSGESAAHITSYDPATGRAARIVGGDGLVTENAFDSETGLLVRQSVGPAHLGLTTTYLHDSWGRIVEKELPDGVREVTWRAALAGKKAVTLTYAVTDGSRAGPVSITVEDLNERIVCRAKGLPAPGLKPEEALDDAASDLRDAWRGRLAERDDSIYAGGRLIRVERTFDADAAARQYSTSEFFYDGDGRVVKTIDADGTVIAHEYDSLGQLVRTREGTDPSGRDATLREKRYYDARGLLIALRVYPEDPGADEDSRGALTEYGYDWRRRLIAELQPEGDGERRAAQYLTYDNLDRVTEVSVAPPGDQQTRLARGIFHDPRGQVWRTVEYNRDDPRKKGETFFWYDAAGRKRKTLYPGGAYRKEAFDSGGRAIGMYFGFDPDEPGAGPREEYREAVTRDGIADDIVLEAEEVIRDSRDRVALETHFVRPAGSTIRGLLLPNDSCRMRQAAFWYDHAGAVRHNVVVKTERIVWMWRPPEPPPGGGLVERTDLAYDEWNRLAEAVLPDGRAATYGYDNRGRTTLEAQNAAPEREATEERRGENIRTYSSYDAMDRLVLTRIECNDPAGKKIQETAYDYGVQREGPYASRLSTGRLLRAIRHPDPATGSAGTRPQDTEYFAYDAQGRVVLHRRCAEASGEAVEHQYRYDARGRLAADSATEVPAAVDSFVRSVAYDYSAWGEMAKVTAFAEPWGGGAVRNEVAAEHNGFGQLTATFEEHDGAVRPETPRIAYRWSEATEGDGLSRLLALEYPRAAGGAVTVGLVYRGADEREEPWRRTDWVFGRVSAVMPSFLNGRVAAAYEYEGLGRVAERRNSTTWPGFAVRQRRTVDSFERITRLSTDLAWGDRSVLRIEEREYQYDTGGRMTLSTERATPWGEGNDWIRLYDRVGRLAAAARGRWSQGMLSGVREIQKWELSGTGNWEVHQDGGRTETREHDLRDAIVRLGADRSATYDGGGNLMGILGMAFRYDAWNRLVELRTDDGAACAIERDGLGRPVRERIAKRGEAPLTRDLYYRWPWQVITAIERSDGREAREDYVWGAEHADEILLRRRAEGARAVDTFFVQDALWNVTALTNGVGLPIERYSYGPYGASRVWDGFLQAERTESAWGNRLRFQGRWVYSGDVYDFRHRAYAPRLGRFLQKDPLRIPFRHNLYAAPFGESLLDPEGLEARLRNCARYDQTLAGFRIGFGVTIGGEVGAAAAICDCCDQARNVWIKAGWAKFGLHAHLDAGVGLALQVKVMGYTVGLAFQALDFRILQCDVEATVDRCAGKVGECVRCGSELAIGIPGFSIGAGFAGLGASAAVKIAVEIYLCFGGDDGTKGGFRFCHGWEASAWAYLFWFRKSWSFGEKMTCQEIQF
jgi:RHS repeat-associated protein